MPSDTTTITVPTAIIEAAREREARIDAMGREGRAVCKVFDNESRALVRAVLAAPPAPAGESTAEKLEKFAAWLAADPARAAIASLRARAERGEADRDAARSALAECQRERDEIDAARASWCEDHRKLRRMLAELHVLAAGSAEDHAPEDDARGIAEAIKLDRADYLAVAQALGIVYQADGHADEPGSVEEIVAHVREMQATETEWMEARYFGFSADGSCRACGGDGYHDVGEDRTVECDECKGHGMLPRLLAARFLTAGWRRRTHVERARVGHAKELGEAIAAEARGAIEEAKRLRASLSRATERGDAMREAIRTLYVAWGAVQTADALAVMADAVRAWDARDAAGGEVTDG